MRVKKERKPVQVECVDCSRMFIAFNRNALRCPECRKEHIRRCKTANQARYRSVDYIKGKERKIVPKLTIREVLRELEKYNKVHKTHLSYGQFVSLMEGGKIYG